MAEKLSLDNGLRHRLSQGRSTIMAGAHDALSARLVEEAGFDGIWLSGLGAATTKGLPDIGLTTQTEILNLAQDIVGVTRVPLLVDCDCGFGDSNNVRRTVNQFERIGVAGICIEDNQFPKRNSFYCVERRLVSRSEMVKKLRAGIAARNSDDLLIVARTEAIVAGLGIDEALSRAYSYRDAGVDSLVVHSRSWDDLRRFLDSWKGGVPLIAIPTAYPEVSAQELQAAGFAVVIFANQALRAAVYQMRAVLGQLRASLTNQSVENHIASLSEIESLVRLRDWLPAQDQTD